MRFPPKHYKLFVEFYKDKYQTFIIPTIGINLTEYEIVFCFLKYGIFIRYEDPDFKF